MAKNKTTPVCKQAQSKKAHANELRNNYNTNNYSIADIPIRIQCFTKSQGKLTKSISLDENNNIVKDATECKMTSGTVKTITTTPKEFPELLESIDQNQALALSNIDYSESRKITTSGQEHDDVISRSSRYFSFVSGPAFLLFDVDVGKEYSPDNIEQVLADITRFIPEFEQAAKIIRPSTSSDIKLKEVEDE